MTALLPPVVAWRSEQDDPRPLVVLLHGRGTLAVDNPALLPNVSEIEEIREPWVKLSVVTPTTYIGPLMELSTGRRGSFRPQVWEMLPQPRLFMRELAKKAGLPADARLARCRVSRYRVIKWIE